MHTVAYVKKDREIIKDVEAFDGFLVDNDGDLYIKLGKKIIGLRYDHDADLFSVDELPKVWGPYRPVRVNLKVEEV